MIRASHQSVKKRLLTAGLSGAQDVLTLLLKCSGSHQLNAGLALMYPPWPTIIHFIPCLRPVGSALEPT
jgi:hypothetical protein